MSLYAIFCLPKNKNRSVDPPCLDPLDFGIGDEPEPQLLLRRDRVGLFNSEVAAIEALEKYGPRNKLFSYVVLPCRLVESA